MFKPNITNASCISEGHRFDKKRGWRLITSVIFWVAFVLGGSYAWGEPEYVLEELPMQSGGRIKPFGTFAEESLRLVYGKSRYKGRGAVDVVFTWLLSPREWEDVPLIEIVRPALRENLNLDKSRRHFSALEVWGSARLQTLLQELQGKQDRKEKLNPYFQDVQRLSGQLRRFQEIRSGEGMRWIPHGQGPLLALTPSSSQEWMGLSEMVAGSIWDLRFRALSRGFARSVDGGGGGELSRAVRDFVLEARAQGGELYPSRVRMRTELFYNRLSPFRWAWVGYLLAGLCFFVSMGYAHRAWRWLGWGAVLGGFAFHTWGFGLRVYLTGRPPVSNMYETVVWVAWGALLFAFLSELWGYLAGRRQEQRQQQRPLVLLAATLVGVLCLITADVAPTVLDPSLQPLQAVLRSNLWLIVHVMTITLSYAAFFLSMVISDIALIYCWRGVPLVRLSELVRANDRAIQVGVVLLAAGTILGGVWADYSWGRFWGWDPKETWAFIALMGYIAILHARLVGWLRGVGFFYASILCFSLIIMAWYGVNFVLGAGLHSYGFGGGGVEYVSAFVLLHAIFVVATAIVLREQYRA